MLVDYIIVYQPEQKFPFLQEKAGCPSAKRGKPIHELVGYKHSSPASSIVGCCFSLQEMLHRWYSEQVSFHPDTAGKEASQVWSLDMLLQRVWKLLESAQLGLLVFYVTRGRWELLSSHSAAWAMQMAQHEVRVVEKAVLWCITIVLTLQREVSSPVKPLNALLSVSLSISSLHVRWGGLSLNFTRDCCWSC